MSKWFVQPAKTAVSFRFSPLGKFRQEGRLRLSLVANPYITLVCNIRKKALISLFWNPNGLNE